jgi:serine/threonine protein kinase
MRSPSVDHAPIAPGDTLADRYQIEREVGVGGMAVVYLAYDLRCSRPVAVKILHPALGSDAATRFRHEIATVARLQHPNIVPLFDAGDAGGMPFCVMPFVSGETLRDRLERERRLALVPAIRIAMSVARALDYARKQQIVHRDVKPENILLLDGEVMLTDFGIALSNGLAGSNRITLSGVSIGTPVYMSPEQAAGDDVDHRSDIYSLAVVLYEMLCGITPHTGPNAQSIMARVLMQVPRPASELRRELPAPVDAAIARALGKVPDGRFATAREFCDAIDPAFYSTSFIESQFSWIAVSDVAGSTPVAQAVTS